MGRLTHIKIRKTQENVRYYKQIRYPAIPLNVNDIYVTTTVGDRLDLLANQFYKNTELWWVIAMANMDIIQRDSFAVKSGIEIRIPANHRTIVKDFERLNNSNSPY
tara:strand:+ start:61 stop:378 length:318 start_codon:yes stop_codon:yes gene_type:complete